MKSFLSILVSLMAVFSISTPALAQESTDDVIPAIYDTDSVRYISIFGNKIKSVEDIHSLFIKALGLPKEYKKTFADLEVYLSNPQYTPKNVHITIYSAGLLMSAIGEKEHDALLEALNNAQDKNFDKDGFKNLSILYWQ